MVAVIKVGGSLAETPAVLKNLGVELCKLAESHHFIVVPGGGVFADVVRQLDAKFQLSAALSHKLAILAMNQYGLLLSEIIPNSLSSESGEVALRNSKKGIVSIFLPGKVILKRSPFEPSWDVTSDSIAAQVALMLGIKLVVFVTNVDGIYSKDPKVFTDGTFIEEISASDLLNFESRTAVDKFLPRLLLKNDLDCFVVNGKHPERTKAILDYQKTIATHILAKK